MYVSLARACDPSTRKLEEIFNHFTYQIETPPHTPHIEYKSFSRVSFEIFNSHEMTINVMYQKRILSNFHFFFSLFPRANTIAHIPLAIRSKLRIFIRQMVV